MSNEQQHDDNFESYKREATEIAGDIPLYYMLCMSFLQELEERLCFVLVIQKQIEIAEHEGVEFLTLDLTSDDFDAAARKILKDKTFFNKIDESLRDFDSQSQLIEVIIKAHNFQYLDPKSIDTLGKLYHEGRKVRNSLAHDYWIDRKFWVESKTVEDELRRMLFDVQYLHSMSDLMVKTYAKTFVERYAIEAEDEDDFEEEE